MVKWKSEALIVDAARSPIGRRNGTLSGIRGDELAGQVLNGLVERVGLEPGEVEDVQMGCVTQVGEQGWNVGRMAVLVAGWPETVCGTTVDRQCGSSMQTNFNAAAAVWSGQLDLVVSGGVEMMSRVPMGSNNGSMSPLVWDLAHVGNYEELWLLRETHGDAAMRPDIDDLYDAFEHPRDTRPSLPLLRPADVQVLPKLTGADREKLLANAERMAQLGFTEAAEQRLLRTYFEYAMPEGTAYSFAADLRTLRGDAERATWWQETADHLLALPTTGSRTK